MSMIKQCDCGDQCYRNRLETLVGTMVAGLENYVGYKLEKYALFPVCRRTKRNGEFSLRDCSLFYAPYLTIALNIIV